MAKLIVVDIQEAYKSDIGFSMKNFIKYLHNFSGSILYLYNGEDSSGFKENIKDWLANEAADAGFDEKFIDDFYLDTLQQIHYVDKGYAFFRDAMDSGWSDEDIVSLIKLMFDTNTSDGRELQREDVEERTSLNEEEIDELINGDVFIALPGVEEELSGWNGATLIGGAMNECLKEITLLLDAMGYSYSLNRKFIY